jgi:hypothetical protein
MPTAALSLSCALADRPAAARFAARSTRRAGASRFTALVSAARLMLTGRAELRMRTEDRDLFLAIACRDIKPEKVLSSLRAAAALGVA